MLLIMSYLSAKAQDGGSTSESGTGDNMFTIDTPLTINLKEDEDEEEVVAPKKKKRKKKVFYEMKTRKGYTKKGYGESTVIELFYTMKKPEMPNPYVRDVYWYDHRRKAIRKGGEIDLKYGEILHGPYEKKKGDKVIEKGIFYVGTKHGRWLRFDNKDLLLDKQKYYKGWPKESLVSYYDDERTKIKEVIPVEYGEKEGNYYYFFENGILAVRGEYHYDQKVGKWTENHFKTKRRKKVIQYPENPYDDTTRPYVWREWNIKGKIIYENAKKTAKSAQ